MPDGCCGSTTGFDGTSRNFRRALMAVIAINAAMFVTETASGLYAQSMALRADALDFLGDTVTYAMTLVVIGHSLKWRAGAALVKGVSLAMMGVWVFGATVYRIFVNGDPSPLVMGTVGLLALLANLTSVLLLLRWRNGDANVRSVWLCSRNDALGNIAVLIAAAGVLSTASPVPDLLVAALIAGLFLYSSFHIIVQARAELSAA